VQISDLLILALATNQAVEIYRHSPLLAELRANLESEPGFVGKLAQCNWCMSVWVAAFLAVFWLSLPALMCWPIAALAVSRLANLINDYTFGWNRTPQDDNESPEA
jgi:hypothetical protein